MVAKLAGLTLLLYHYRAELFPQAVIRIDTRWLSSVTIYFLILLAGCFVKTYLSAPNLLLCTSPSAMSHFSHSWPFALHSYSFGYLRVGAGGMLCSLVILCPLFLYGLWTHTPRHLNRGFKGNKSVLANQSTSWLVRKCSLLMLIVFERCVFVSAWIKWEESFAIATIITV